MKKSDLKTGMWVELRNGDKSIVLLNTRKGDILSGKDFWGPLESFKDDLKCPEGSEHDIVRIYQPIANAFYHDGKESRCIWQRKETLEITDKEAVEILKKHFGKEVKIKLT